MLHAKIPCISKNVLKQNLWHSYDCESVYQGRSPVHGMPSLELKSPAMYKSVLALWAVVTAAKSQKNSSCSSMLVATHTAVGH